MMARLSLGPVTGFLVLLVSYGYFLPRIDNVNSTSRMNLVYAVADQGTIRIDDYHKNTIDKAFYEGHYYTEKSIGPSVIALPVYVAFREFAVSVGITDPPEIYAASGGYTRAYHGMALIVATFVTVSLSSALGAVLLYAFVRRWVTPQVALVTMLAYGLATIAFPYSSQFYSHQLAGSAMFAAFFLLWRIVVEGAKLAGAWVAGMLIGIAVITEYITVVFAILLLAWAVYKRPRLTTVLPVVAAALPWALLSAVYNIAAFGSPLPVGYSHTTNFTEVHSQGFMGLTAPTWATLYGITFSPYRGLFFLSPFLMLATYGFWLMWKARLRSLVVLLAAMCVSLLLYNASYVMWSGGFSIGPRHLVPMLPFLCIPVAWVLQHSRTHVSLRVLSAGLIAVSMVSVWIQSLGGPDFPADTIQRPLTQYSLPHLLRGELASNLGTALGLHGYVSLLPWAVLVLSVAVVGSRVLLHAEARAETQRRRSS